MTMNLEEVFGCRGAYKGQAESRRSGLMRNAAQVPGLLLADLAEYYNVSVRQIRADIGLMRCRGQGIEIRVVNRRATAWLISQVASDEASSSKAA